LIEITDWLFMAAFSAHDTTFQPKNIVKLL